MASVSVRSLDIAYGNLKIIDDLSIEIEDGEFIVLLGPSGCGKSTLLSTIAGLTGLTAGQIWLDGRNVTWTEPKDRGIGMVFQSYALYPTMSVRQNLSFGLRMAGTPKPEIARRVSAAASLLRLEPLLDRRPAELSGGQRQRVAIGRALVRDVGVYLFDEPLSNLDAKLRSELRVELRKLHAELKSTMIYVTHDQIEALTLADRVAVMHGGVIQQLATPREIYRRPANRFVAGFVGSPAMNFVAGAFTTDGDRPGLKLADGSLVDLSGYDFGVAPRLGQQLELGIRPEQLALRAPQADEAAVQMVVGIEEPMGADTLIWGQVAGRSFSVRVEPDASYPADARLPVSFAAAHASLFDVESGARV